MSWRVQNLVAIGWICYEQEHYRFSLDLEFHWTSYLATSIRLDKAVTNLITVECLQCESVRQRRTFGQYQRQTNATMHLPESHYATSWWIYTEQQYCVVRYSVHDSPDSKVHGANVGPAWGRQGQGGPHVGHVNLAIWIILEIVRKSYSFLMHYQD